MTAKRIERTFYRESNKMKNSKKYKLAIILTMVMLGAPPAVISMEGGGK